jgi:hypothetical protein
MSSDCIATAQSGKRRLQKHISDQKSLQSLCSGTDGNSTLRRLGEFHLQRVTAVTLRLAVLEGNAGIGYGLVNFRPES